MKRVVVTGLGAVSPLACGAEISWQRLLDGRSGAGKITSFDASSMRCQIACEVPEEDDEPGAAFNADEWIAPKEQRRMERFIHFAVIAAQQALEQSGWHADNHHKSCRSGVLVGSGIGGLASIAHSSIVLHEKGANRISPFFVPGSLINLCSGQIAIRNGLKGPNHSVATACASGSHAIGDAARIIACGEADVMVAGGAEAAICPIGIAGFAACRALSTRFNDQPEKASRPFDVDRDGFVMGEGAGILVLEEYEHARARGATILAEIAGYGMSGDAYHVTSPDPSGEGALRAMQAALRNSGMPASDIDYINAHGTSTSDGDRIELRALEQLFAGREVMPLVSSSKSATGHLLGAAGGLEAVFCVLALRDQIAPPTINLDKIDGDTQLRLVAHKPQSVSISVVMSNSFGFGGTNACLIFSKVE